MVDELRNVILGLNNSVAVEFADACSSFVTCQLWTVKWKVECGP